MKKLLLAGAVVVFGGIAATVAAAADHKAVKHAAPAHASVITPVASKEAGPKKHHAPKKHHGRVHHKHHSK
ncbi:MAG: hypothetical protein JO332_16770 [Planctomycetaceae bacterium]|nr:hypothetical protein [Planctomycetaceae bacterium]